MLTKRLFISCLVVILAFGSGYFSYGFTHKTSPGASSTLSTKDYPLLAKRVLLEDPNDPVINFASLRQQFTKYFSDNNVSGGLYFEYLPTGTSARIDADIQSVAASLMKLPAAMDTYRAAEQGKIDLDKKITLQQSWLDAAYGDLYKKGAGYQLTIRDAVKIMIEKSDNTAHKAVTLSTFGMVTPTESVLNAIDVDLTQNNDLTVSIGPRSYGSFLKCLYFACYLNKDHSQELLQYLTDTEFDNRLIAGIDDKSVKVAHKIGVYDSVQSDCGIVFVPKRNYVLCVMLKGPDTDSTNRHIANLSRLAYKYVEQR